MLKKGSLASIVFSVLLLLGVSIGVANSYQNYYPSAEEEEPGAWVINLDGDSENDGQGEIDEEDQI